MVSESQLTFLRSIDTPTVCNLIEIVAPERRGAGYTASHLHCPFPDLPPMVGFAKTATIRARDPVSGPSYMQKRMDYLDYVAATPRPSVVVIARFGRPEIFNTDQGSLFTSFAFTTTLKDADVRISMDGRGRWMDDVFIERLWRSLKYECVYLNAFQTGGEARTGIGRWVAYYNADRPHSVFGGGRRTRSMLPRQTRRNWRRNRTQNPP